MSSICRQGGLRLPLRKSLKPIWRVDFPDFRRRGMAYAGARGPAFHGDVIAGVTAILDSARISPYVFC